MLTGRAENHFRGNPDIDDTIRRLRAYEEAGADVLFAPGLATDDEIRTVCAAVSKPVSVMALPHMTTKELAAAGVQRVSVPLLATVALSALMAAATDIRETGSFSSLST